MFYANEKGGADIEKKTVKGAELMHIPIFREKKIKEYMFYANEKGGADI